MDRKPDDLLWLSKGNGNGSKARPVPSESFAPKEPVNITADASIFEVLLRGASEEEARLMRRLLIEWSRGDENTFPHQLTLITLSQWRAAARVPLETARVLQQHHDKLEDSATRFVRAADTKLVDFQKVGKLITQFEAQIARLTNEGDEALKRLHQITANLLQAEERAKRAARNNDFFILALAFLMVAALACMLGAVTCRYMFLRGWVH